MEAPGALASVGIESVRASVASPRALTNQSSPVPPLPSFVLTLAATGTTLSISMFSSAEYSVWRAVWNSLVGLNTALALRAAPALWRANRAWSSPMISSAAISIWTEAIRKLSSRTGKMRRDR